MLSNLPPPMCVCVCSHHLRTNVQISSAAAIGNYSCPSRAVGLSESSPSSTLLISYLFIFMHDRSPRTGGYGDSPRLRLGHEFCVSPLVGMWCFLFFSFTC
ncbi:hypothetical protein PoB_003597000 [Plakobranchus ocellatus]|uniref:Uncharacterized protein n=1 Tax=Plakobranchus ocellatus TaxID=259542 RepID=A0AAV4ARG6_9GAST|nr:hypothetical protein PoB_003597000 [Plakobranchus ocellatus]